MIITGVGVPILTATLSPVPVYVVPPSGGGGVNAVEVWTLVVAVAAVLASILAAVLLRKTGRGTVAAAEKSANASQSSSTAAKQAATAATTAAAQLDTWRQREESMRMLRWAADKALDGDSETSVTGQRLLKALAEHSLVQPEDRAFIRSVRLALIEPALAGLDDGDEVVVDT